MFIHIDPSNGLAIYNQIVRQVKFAVAAGAIAPGELAPSVREMARDLAINPNTVARAYQQLQVDDVLASVRGTGLAVAQGAPQRCREERTQLIGDRLRQALAEATHSGLTPEEIRNLIDAELSADQV
ncbi:MAG: GntR family transcriptional regulator [Pirellulaceae bacterium]